MFKFSLTLAAFFVCSFTLTSLAHEDRVSREEPAGTDVTVDVDDDVISDVAGAVLIREDASAQSKDDSSDEGSVAIVGEVFYMSFKNNTMIPGVGVVANEDVVSYTPATNQWALVFDGSDVGLAAFAIDGLAQVPGSSDLLLSFADPGNIPGLIGGPGGTLVDDSDIVRFHPTSLGANTAGSFTFYFDGSDIGLTTNAEDIDAIAFSPAGELLISTLGPFNAGSATGNPEDVFRFTGTTGAVTSGILNIYFDGSDVGLTTNSENVDALAVTPGGLIYLNTTGNFNVAGIQSGCNPDVLLFTPAVLGDITIGTYTLYLETTEIGLHNSARISSLEIITN